MKKLFLYGLTAAIVLSIGLLISCGSSSSSSSDDDTSDDDAAVTCTSAYDYMYNTCGYTFTDSTSADIPLADVITACEADESPYALADACGECVAANQGGDCDTEGTCLTACAGTDDDDDSSPA